MTYNFKMKITVGGVRIPDPSSWKYEVADIDYGSGRDASGKLHRDRVATKINYEFEWKALDWKALQIVLKAVDKASFKLVAPDPTKFQSMRKGNYYVGNRTGNAKYFLPGRDDMAVFDLKMKLIEY